MRTDCWIKPLGIEITDKFGRIDTNKFGRIDTSKFGRIDTSKFGRIDTSKHGRERAGNGRAPTFAKRVRRLWQNDIISLPAYCFLLQIYQNDRDRWRGSFISYNKQRGSYIRVSFS